MRKVEKKNFKQKYLQHIDDVFQVASNGLDRLEGTLEEADNLIEAPEELQMIKDLRLEIKKVKNSLICYYAQLDSKDIKDIVEEE